MVFFITFIIYLLTQFPSVAPYRDTGEMVAVAHTLGVAHPPGYPFYTLISKLFLLIMPLASEGYRLNVLSGLASAFTAWVVYRIFIKLGLQKWAARLLAIVFATSYLQWYLSLVSEMYTLNTLFAAGILLLLMLVFDNNSESSRKAAWYVLAAFLMGVGMGNRMDLLLIVPGIGWLVWRDRTLAPKTKYLYAVLAGVAGYSIFFYLMARSNAAPFFDWNHPATLERLWASIARKTHGGTLDLISAGYASGENFGPGISFYFNHLWQGFGYIGIPLAVAGLYAWWQKRRDWCVATFISWVVCGPLFIYLGNMPPNTHALAILEAHFLLPNLIVALWMGAGLAYLFETNTDTARRAVLAVVPVIMIAANMYNNVPELVKRNNMVAYDFSRNILRSLPANAILVMKKDVQLFSIWNQRYVEGRRPDVAVVSQGLAASAWYQDTMRRQFPDLTLMPLRNKADWGAFAAANTRPVFVSSDAEYMRPDGYTEEPDGLVWRVAPDTPKPTGPVLFNELYPRRGKYFYRAYREFFTPDLIEDYARGRLQLGRYLMERGQNVEARENFAACLAMQPLFPFAANYTAFTYFNEGKFAEAGVAFGRAVTQFRDLLALSKQYRSMPDVQQGIGRDLGDTLLSQGVCAERTGNTDESLKFYSQAVEANPAFAKAYFNRAVVMWKRNDWPGVVRELEQALAIDPSYQEAAYYLQQARLRLGKK